MLGRCCTSAQIASSASGTPTICCKLRCTPKGTEVLNRVALFHADESWTPLALSRGLLYVCQNKREKIGAAPARLRCYDLREG